MAKIKHGPQTQSRVQVTVAVISALGIILAGPAFWESVRPWIAREPSNPNPVTIPTPAPGPCELIVSQIWLDKANILENETTGVGVRVDIPGDKSVTLSWRAVNGTISPPGRSNRAEVKYIAPPYPADDSIAVDITAPGCRQETRSINISVLRSPAVQGGEKGLGGDCPQGIFIPNS